MKKTLALIVATGAFVSGTLLFLQAQEDVSTQGLQPGDATFTTAIDSSAADELTILSFNVRDVDGRDRTLEDFQQLADLIDDADIVVFQELGAKAISSEKKYAPLKERFAAMAEVYKSYMGPEWEFVFAETFTPENYGAGAELPCIAYRRFTANYTIDIQWKSYFDLGERRDMGLFDVTCSKGGQHENFTIGSVHTKPTCPGRGEELLQIASYIEANENMNYVIVGDMNWGYYSTCTDRYVGEEAITQLHENGKVFQVFHGISYTGKGKEEDFRTNLDLRSTPQMYDQILLCKAYAGRMAEGGKLGEDCGFISYSNETYFQDAMDDVVREQIKGVKAYMKKNGISYTSTEGKQTLKDMEEYIRSKSTTVDAATHRLSDHKPVWVRLTLF